MDQIISKEQFDNFTIEIKHGCTEYYKSYPKFKNINFDGEQDFAYHQNWQEKEDLIDKSEPTRSENNKKFARECSGNKLI